MYKVAAIGWFLMANYLFFSPSTGIPSFAFLQFNGSDKLVHGILFFVGTLVCYKAFSPPFISFKKLGYLLFVYGVLIEFAQKYFTTTRSFDVLDILADTLGISLALIFIHQFIIKKLPYGK